MDETEYMLMVERGPYADKLSLKKVGQMATNHLLDGGDHPPMVILEDDQGCVTMVGIINIPDSYMEQLLTFAQAAELSLPYHKDAMLVKVAMITRARMVVTSLEEDFIGEEEILEHGKPVLAITFYDVLSQHVYHQLHEVLQIGQTYDLRLWQEFDHLREEAKDIFLESVLIGANYG